MNIFKKNAFTISEVMLTLSLIGVLATLTISTVGSSVQQKSRLSEFRTAYARMEAVLKEINSDNGMVYSCYGVPTETEIDEFGLKIASGTQEASNATQCQELEKTFARLLGAAHSCGEHASGERCLPLTRYPKGNECFTSFTNVSAHVLDNGMTIFSNNNQEGLKLFAVDVNGRKGPNKWGLDIFPFSLKVSESVDVGGSVIVKSVGIFPPTCNPLQGGGKTTEQMMKESAGRRN